MKTATNTLAHDHLAHHGSAIRANLAQPLPSVELEALAELLTHDSLYTSEALQRLEQTEGLFSLDEIGNRASQLVQVLDEVIAASTVDQERRQAIDTAFTSSGLDSEALKQIGINAEYTAGMTHLIAALLQGKPPIDIETVGPYACEHLTEDGVLQIDEQNIPNDEQIGIELAVLFRQLADASESPVRIVALLDELNNYREGNLATKRFTPEEQDQYVTAMAKYFEQKGIIQPGDSMGGEVLLLRETEQVERVPQLIEKLSASNKGQIIRDNEEGGLETITFMPKESFVDSLNLRSRNRRKEFKRRGIMLQEKGQPLCQALDASAFLGEENRHIIHLVMLDHDMAAQQDKVFAILNALDIARPSSYHNIFTDSNAVTPETAVYAVAKLFSAELKRLQAALPQQS
ncbi:MAG TPA: hypothetical protein VIJ68_04285 [Candidatus Saccharimonadales bacterium]